MTSSWFFLSTLNYDARSNTYQIDFLVCLTQFVIYSRTLLLCYLLNVFVIYLTPILLLLFHYSLNGLSEVWTPVTTRSWEICLSFIRKQILHQSFLSALAVCLSLPIGGNEMDVAVLFVFIYIYIYIYICREREREREQSSPITGLDRPRMFQEVKVPRLRDNGTGWW